MKQHFHPFAGLYISKSCFSPHPVKIIINETKNISANDWCFSEGCEKSPSAEILTFLSGTSSLRSKIHEINFKYKLIIQYNNARKIVFWKKENSIIWLYKGKKNYSNRFEFWYFPPYFDSTLLFTFHYANKYNISAF